MKRTFLALVLGAALAGLGYSAFAQHSESPPSGDAMQKGPADHADHTVPGDARVLVKFPEHLRVHTIANMRDHLLALAEIQEALARGSYDEAGKIAEDRLGMSSLPVHGAHEVAKYMPQGMQDAGTAMHRGASRFALELQHTAITRDLKPALAALAETTRACVACHAGYRLQ